MTVPRHWMSDVNDRSERIGGLLHQAAIQWVTDRRAEARLALAQALQLMAENDEAIARNLRKEETE